MENEQQEQMIKLFSQCSPMQKLLIIDALEEMLSLPEDMGFFDEDESIAWEYVANDSQHQLANGDRGKVLPFRPRT